MVDELWERDVLGESATTPLKIFVVGNSRSGTTMMGRILGRHTDIFTFNELHFFEELWFPVDNPEPLEPEAAVALMSRLIAIQRNGYFTQGDSSQFAEEAAALVHKMEHPITPPDIYAAYVAYETHLQGKQHVCDQTPRNVYYLEEILALYPQAYVINMIRDPRAILLSQKNRWKGRFSGSRKIPFFHIVRTWADYHPVTISLLWRSGISAGDAFAHHPRVLQVRFEDLANNAQEITPQICAFLGLSYQADMLNVPQTNSSNRQDRPEQQGVDPWIADRWQQGGLTTTDIYINQALVGKQMEAHRYELQAVRPNVILLGVQGLGWFVKMGFAFLLNLKRVKNLGPALKKRLLN